MKRFLMANAIACAISVTALGGDIPSDGAPKSQSQGTTSPTVLIPSGGDAITTSDAVLTAILTALGLASI